MARLRRVLAMFGILAILAVLAIAGAAWWALSSDAALSWAVGELARRTDGRVTVERPTGSVLGPLVTPRVTYDDGDVRIVAEDVRLEWSALRALDGEVRIESLEAASVRVTVRPSDAPASPPASLALPVRIEVEHARAGVVDIDGLVARDVAIAGYAGGPEGHAVRSLRADGDFGRLHASGRIAGTPPFALAADAHLAHDLIAAHVLAGGVLEALALDVHALSHGAEALGTGEVRPFAREPLAGVYAQVAELDPAAFDAALPGARLSAEIEGSQTADAWLAGTVAARNLAPGYAAQGRVPMETLAARFRYDGATLALDDAQADLGAAGTVKGTAMLGPERGNAALAFDALNLRALHPTLRVTRLAGMATAEYEGDVQRVRARVAERGITLAADAERRGDRVEVHRFEAAFGSSRAEGRAELSLAGAQPFSASLRFSQFDPAALGDFPRATLNGEARARGRLAPAWSADVAIDLANSRFRDAPLAGSVRGVVSASAVRDADVNLRLAENTLRASGSYARNGGSVVFDLDARRPDRIDARLGGRFTARGRLEGRWPDPTINVEVEGERLVWAGRTRAEGVRARAEGTLAAHTLALDGRIDGYPVKGTAEGAWRDARWSGTLGTLEVTGEYPFALDGAMPLTASRELVEAGPGRALFAGGRLELDSVRWQDERLASRGRFAALPALPFLRAAGASVHPKSDLRLVGQWDVRASPKLDGTVSIARESGDLVLPTDPAVAAGLRTLAIDAKLAADAIDAVARIDSRIGTGTATVATSGIARTSALKAEATLQVPTLKPFEALVGTTALVDGRVDLALAAGGTLGQPVVTGTLAGRDMRVDSPLYGIALRDGELRATLTDSVLKLEQFTARGDRGRFVAEGAMPLRGGDPEARLTWRAEDLSLFSRPDRRLQVDGTGTLNLERGRLALRGALKADSAYFEFERPAVAQLDDDIVVRGRPRERRAEAFRSALLDLDLELDFGDDFRILGAGLESTLRGRMRVRTAPDGTLVAKGTVTSERGTYYAFGQKLTIDRGALIFDGPIDNPSLDVLALRKGLQVEAGVELTGTVRVPRLRLVSQPPVSDAEKLSWLTLGSGPEAMTGANLALVQAAASAVLQGGSQLPLGRRVAQAVGLDDITFRGSGAAGSQVVAIGKRLSDRVYVEYEQGVVATNFIVRLSYALSRFISASAETGRATGVGVYYRRSFE